MKIELTKVTIGELVEGYADNSATEEGVVGYGGRLNIRPKYQREFVYDDKKRNAVMESVWKGFPLNVMYWVRAADDHYELLDGQQRTISICQFVQGDYIMKLDGTLTNFDGLSKEHKARILGYPLRVYVCDGTEDEQIDWFKIINIAGERLTEQEMRNAIYNGPWITHAKQRFSKTNCVAYQLGHDYMKGSPIRQDYLETALRWISGGHIEEYMVAHRHDENSDELWQYFQAVIHWVESHFTEKRKEMQGVAWGDMYARHRDDPYQESHLRAKVRRLMQDGEIDNKRGIYWYVMDGDERHLHLRTFDQKTRREAYERQKGICPHCGKHFELGEMDADHITPWSKGGLTERENCQMLCKECNLRKGAL